MRKIKQICLTFIFACFMGALTLAGAACGDDKQITLSFNVNGGASISDVKLDAGESYVLPTPEREGYSFEGWYTNAEFSGEAVTEVVANSNNTYYAKWEQLYLVTLSLNGGALSYDPIYLKAGDVIYDSVKDYIPEKAGYQFGEWFLDESMNKVLGKNTRMSESALTLYAKYKVPYTVEIWTEKLDEAGKYEKTAEDVIGYEYAGVEYTSEQKQTGFREVVLDSEEYKSVVTLTISETASANVFKHYFNRETYTVSFDANYPNGESAEKYSVPVVYEQGVEVPYNYTYNGYCLIGWEADGVVYDAKYIENSLYNNDAEVEADIFYPERNTTLYAVWLKGYVDIFGNGDFVYLVEKQQEEKTTYSVYLSRAGILFEGRYQASSKQFTFSNVNKDKVLSGKLNEDGTFIYSDESRAEIAYQRFVFGYGLIDEHLYLGEYNEVTYAVSKVVNEEVITEKSKGIFSFNEEGLLVATLTEGEMAGQTLTMTVGYVPSSDGSSYARAFQIRNDKEVEFGEMIRFAVGLYEGETYVNYYIYYGLTLNGFNTATVCEGEDNYVTYNYRYIEDTSMLYLYNSGESTPTLTAQIMDLECYDGVVRKGYAVYTEDMDSSFSYNGGTLTLDGYLNLKYERADGTVYEGYYTTTSSILGGTLVSFLEGKTLHNILIEFQDISIGGQTMHGYNLYVKSENYAEYYYLGSSGLLPYPVFVVDGNEATFYDYSSSVGYIEASKGDLVYDEATGLYTYTAKEILVDETSAFAKVEEVVLSLDAGETYYYSMHYWYSYTDKDGEAVNYDVKYTSDKGELVLVSGMAIYKENGSIIKGIYQKTKDGVVAIQNAKGELVYVQVDDENKTFVTMEYAPYTAYLYLSSQGKLTAAESISFDGLGGAKYTIVETVEETELEKFYYGTIVQEEKTTMHGLYIFRFIPNDGEDVEGFRFVQMVLGNYACFVKEQVGVATVYEAEEGRLELDGFELYATYEGVVGSYYFLSETEIVVSLDGVTRYFDIEGTTFTLRGVEYGYYMYSKNQYIHEIDFLLDGYGKLFVITYGEDGAEADRTEGTYSQNGDIFCLQYNGLEKYGKLMLKEIVYGGYIYEMPVFVEELGDEISQKYVNPEDLSVLELDAYGNAVKYTSTGVQEQGTYLLITDTLLYYVNAAEDDACIYNLDMEELEDGTYVYTGVAKILKLTQKGYYTQDLESLIFTEYGFAILEDSTRYYYNVEYTEDGDENVIIYRDAENDSEANEYGFVAIEFGAFSATKEYNDKLYYANDGYTVVFNRDKETATQYDAGPGLVDSIAFVPTGEAEFIVSATVIINGKAKDATVERNATGTYLNVGFYRYSIEITYLGVNANGTSNSTYKITSMCQVLTAQPYMYWYMYELWYYFTGEEYTNEEGELMIRRDYTLEEVDLGNGKKAWTTIEGETYLVTSFLEKSKYIDSNGNVINAAACTVLYDTNGKKVTLNKVDLTGATTYTASFVGSDGYTYYIYFGLVQSSYRTDKYEFGLTAFTREEILTCTDATGSITYEVALERIIASESGYKTGAMYSATLTKTVGGTSETLETWAAYLDFDGNLQIIVREKNAKGKFISSVYYSFKFIDAEVEDEEILQPEEGTQEPEGDIPADGTEEPAEKPYENPVPFYGSISLIKETSVKTLYSKDGKSWLDVAEDTNEALVFCVNELAYIVYRSTYNVEGNYYMVVLSSTMGYKVVVNGEGEDQYITISQVEVKEESKEESEEESQEQPKEESKEESEE